MSQFLNATFGYLRDQALDIVTPDVDYSREDILKRKEKRIIHQKGEDEALNKIIGVNEDGADLIVGDLDKKHPYWTTAEGKEDRTYLKDVRKLLDGKLEMTYQELPQDEEWVQSIKKLYQAEHGSVWQGSDKQITEDYFEKFNDFQNALGKTTYQGMTDNFWFSEFEDKDLKLVNQTFNTFHKVDATGKGSRPLFQQVTDFVLQSGIDLPTILAMYATGGGSSLLSKYAAPLVMKNIISETIANRASRIASASVVSAGFGAEISLNQQMVQNQMEGEQDVTFFGEDATIDKSEIGTMAAIGAVIPPVLEGASALVSKVVPFVDDLLDLPRQTLRFITSPVKQTLKNTDRGRGAAGFGMLEAQEKAIVRGGNQYAAVDLRDQLIDDVINPASASIQNGFASLKYKDMGAASQQKLRNLFAEFKLKNKGIDEKLGTTELNRLISLMYDEKTLDQFVINNKLGMVNPDKWSTKFANQKIGGGLKNNKAAETFIAVRNEIYELAQSAMKGDKPSKALKTKLMKLYNDVKVIQSGVLASPGEVQLWNSLNTANSRFQKMLEKNPVGQKFAIIKEHKNQARFAEKEGDIPLMESQLYDAEIASQDLLEYILNDKSAYHRLMQFKAGLQTVDDGSKAVQLAINASNKADAKTNIARLEKNQAPMPIRNDVPEPATNDSYSTLMVSLKGELGAYFEAQTKSANNMNTVPYAALDDMLTRRNGLDLLTEIFPESASFYKGLDELKTVLLARVEKKSGQSVIMNMTVARMASDLGTQAGGKFGGFAAPLASVPLLQRMRSIVGDSKWQRAMADTINNNGQIPTWFTKGLKATTNMSDKAIAEMQRDWLTIIYGSAGPKNIESIEKNKAEMKRDFNKSLNEMYQGAETMFGGIKAVQPFQ